MDDLARFQSVFGQVDARVATEALTHSSLVNEREGLRSNERLAFLGDAVIGLIVAEHFAQSKTAKGDLTEERKKKVNNPNLAKVARGLELTFQHGGSLDKEAATLAWAGLYEAAIGAVFLERGYEAAKPLVLMHLGLPPPQ